MAKKTHGTTASGVPITDELISQLAEDAEAGYDVKEIVRRRGGRPPIGSAAASVESVRLEPELRKALIQRARRDHDTTSSVIRKALRSPPIPAREACAGHGPGAVEHHHRARAALRAPSGVGGADVLRLMGARVG